MVLNRFLLFISFFTFCSHLFSQDDVEVIVEITVIAEEDLISPISFAKVENTRTKQISLADINGTFKVLMKSSDTLIISSVGYEFFKLFIPQSFIEKLPSDESWFSETPRLKKIVYLKTYDYMLEEFVVWGLTLEEFKYQFVNMQLNDMINVNSGKVIARNYKSASDGGFGVQTGLSPISALYNRFSKTGRSKAQIKKYRKKLDKYKIYDTVNPYFNTMEYYQLNKDSVDN
jgi:hypothetical protein